MIDPQELGDYATFDPFNRLPFLVNTIERIELDSQLSWKVQKVHKQVNCKKIADKPT